MRGVIDVGNDGQRRRDPRDQDKDGHTVAVDSGSAGPHRPGFRYATDQAEQDARDAAYDAWVKRTEGSWHSPQ